MLGWLQYMEIISLTVISSWDASEKFPSDRGFSPEYFATVFNYLFVAYWVAIVFCIYEITGDTAIIG